MSHFLGGFQTGIDGDALELPARHENGELNNPQQHAFIGKLGGKVSGVQYLNRNHQSEPSQRLILPGLFIREDAVSSYFIGLNSTGALLAASIQQSRQSSAASTNIPSLDYLIESGSRLDETAALLKVNISNFKPSPKSLAAAAIKTYFSNVYSFYPVVDVVLFQSDWEAIYSQPLEEQSILEYMTLYLIIAIGAVCNPATKEVITELQTISDNLYQQAWDLLNDSITKLSVTSVQILLLHVIFLMYRGRGGMAWVLCGLAIRISQAIGLHRRSPRDIDLTEAEIHLRSQLWWSAFCLDAELSLALGRPTALPDSDHDAELFPLDLPDQTLPNKTAITANIYCWKVTLARIQNRFCCVLNRDDSMGSMVEALVRLDSALMKWRDEIPLEYRPQQEILAQDDTYHLVALLHLEYYNMVRALHWALITAVPAKGDMMEDSSNPRIYARETICLSAARSFVKTLNDIIDSEGQIYVFVMSLHVDRYIAALAVLYRSIFRNPGRISVKTDLEYFRAGKIHLERRILGRSVNWGLRNFIDAMLKSAEDLVLQSDRA
ncbi:fungal-specific transcription factor domain-containing protein [Xylogone sp. PMI_703]|nr:fungal-specific transcription factor domain-containing protein [Xylogone sp. PMI_703]